MQNFSKIAGALCRRSLQVGTALTMHMRELSSGNYLLLTSLVSLTNQISMHICLQIPTSNLLSTPQPKKPSQTYLIGITGWSGGLFRGNSGLTSYDGVNWGIALAKRTTVILILGMRNVCSRVVGVLTCFQNAVFVAAPFAEKQKVWKASVIAALWRVPFQKPEVAISAGSWHYPRRKEQRQQLWPTQQAQQRRKSWFMWPTSSRGCSPTSARP